MANCPHCKQQLSINEVKTEEKGKGFIEKEKCTYVHIVIWFLAFQWKWDEYNYW